MPKIQAPAFVTGEVTMSVAMYMAPRISPPEKRAKSGLAKRVGSRANRSPEKSPTVRKMLTGIRQLR